MWENKIMRRLNSIGFIKPKGSNECMDEEANYGYEVSNVRLLKA